MVDVIKPNGDDGSKVWVRVECDLRTRQVRVEGHINDKVTAINLLADAIHVVINRNPEAISLVPPPLNGKAAGHA